MDSPASNNQFRQRTSKELALLSGFLLFGLVLLPVVIYQVGQTVFGAYGGTGYGDFFGTLSAKIRAGDFVAWFLVLAPYLGWQCARFMAFLWRATRISPQNKV